MRENEHHVVRDRINDGKTMNMILQENSNSLEQTAAKRKRMSCPGEAFLLSPVRRSNAEKRFLVFFQHVSPRLDAMLFEFFDLRVRFFVIGLKDQNEIRDRQHSHEFLPFRVPERRSTDAVVDQGEERFLHCQLCVEDDQFRALRHDVVTCVTLHEMRVDLFVAD